MHRKILVAALAVLVVAVVSPAFAKAPHRYSPKPGHSCKKTYRQVKHHGKRFCVKRAPAKKQGAAKTADKVKLHAHLDPTFTRDPLNPFKVTYAYSASATQEAVAAPSFASASADEPAPLPSGVLALYSDGKLECAVNVGSGIEGSECPVSYQALGQHRVTTIYTSGEQSATETEVEQITPLATATDLTVSYSPLVNAIYLASGCDTEPCSLENGSFENADMELGTLTVTIGKVAPWGGQSLVACPNALLHCISLPPGEAESLVFPVTTVADLLVNGDQTLVKGHAIDATMEAPKSISAEGTNLAQVPASDIESGADFFRAASDPKPGYTESVAVAPIRFAPQATSVIIFR